MNPTQLLPILDKIRERSEDSLTKDLALAAKSLAKTCATQQEQIKKLASELAVMKITLESSGMGARQEMENALCRAMQGGYNK